MLSLLLLLILAPGPDAVARETPAAFDEYWYQGLAEINRYELRQARYGELHDGEAVLIFVTEDFLTGPQVKQEYGPVDGAESVLKLNATRRFYTGVYPYTVMTSVFQPVDRPGRPAWKLSSTVTEWCGTAYLQLNREGEGYRATVHSYFQAEGDHSLTLADAWLEGPRSDPGGRRTTRAVLTHTEMLDYWNHHGTDDAGYRDILGLTF